MEACFPSKGYCAINACGKGFPYLWELSNQQEATQAIDISVNMPRKVRGHVVLHQYQVLASLHSTATLRAAQTGHYVEN
jgi:hypothetical protein